MTKSSRLRALLAAGYFPEELPPPFHTESLAKYRKSIGAIWAALPGEYPKSSPEIFSVPRQNSWRRDLTIVNPVAQYHVAKLIADEWIEIRKLIQNGFGSEDITIDTEAYRSVSKPDFEVVRLKHSEVSSSYDYILIGDISRFYGTLYTHAIPWAMYSKRWCKANLNTQIYRQSLGARIDKAVRKGNDDQTLGIPIGPDTSRIISEILAVTLDKAIKEKLSLDKTRAVRHVDDWYIGFDTLGQAEAAISVLAAACRDLELEIHPEKTRCVHAPRETHAPWPAALRQLTFARGQAAQRQSIDHFFSEAFHYSATYPLDNVISYAVNKSRQIRVHPDNWHGYETYLLRAARANPTTIPAIVRILTSYKASGYSIGFQRVEKLIKDNIRRCAPNAFHSEVAWSLFLAKALGIRLPAEALEPVCELESSVVALLALDLRSRELVDGNLNTSLWQQSMNGDGLRSRMWLLAYEAELKGWLSGATPYLLQDNYFRELRVRNISFYDINRNVRHIRNVRPTPPSAALTNLLNAQATQAALAPNLAPEILELIANYGTGFEAY